MGVRSDTIDGVLKKTRVGHSVIGGCCHFIVFGHLRGGGY
jgi:hypothetical protein